MKTTDLIDALAAEARPLERARIARRFYLKLGAGAVLALLGVLLLLGVRPDLGQALQLPMFWLKVLFPASLAVAALVGLRRLGHPGMALGRVPAAVALPPTVMWLLAGAVLLGAPAGERLPLLMGRTWLQCPVTITLLSAPAFGLAFWAMRELAPTRLPLAGAAAGLFAGAAGALAYSIHCPEMQAPFLAAWYALGMLIPAAAGALLGRRLLHW